MSFIVWLKKLGKGKPKRKPPISALEDAAQGPDAQRIRDSFPSALSRPLSAVISADYSSRDDYLEKQEKLLTTLKSFEPDLCSSEEWQVAFRHLFRNRCLRAAGKARQRAVVRALTDVQTETRDAEKLKLGFRAALEQKDWSLAGSCLERLIKGHHVNRDERRRLEACLALQTGHVGEPERLFPNTAQFSPVFRDYLRGKSVAIVGPAASAVLAGEEIEKCDVIVRPNYLRPVPEADQARSGRRTHISFYANGTIKRARVEEPQNQLAGLLPDLDWAILKKANVQLHEDLKKTGKMLVGALDDFMFHGSPNILPFAAHTLLCYGPSKLKVFNSNFFFSRTPYAAYYRQMPSEIAMHNRLMGSMAAHDCISQIHFMDNLQQAGLVELNAESLEVIAMGQDAYLEGLETMYVHPAFEPAQ